MAISKRDIVPYSNIINKSIGVRADYWNLTEEDLENIIPKDVQKQSFIFDLEPSLLPEEPNFANLAFDTFIPVINLHTDLLLNPINWEIKTEGTFICSIGRLYLKWCHKAHDSYINSAKAMATVHEIIKYEKKKGGKFAKWLKKIDNSPEITRSKLYYNNTDVSDEDYEYILLAIKEVEKLNEQVDMVYGEALEHRNLIRFSRKLMFDSRMRQNTTGYSNLSTPLSTVEHFNNVDPSIEDKLNLGLLNSERRLIYSEITIKNNNKWYTLMERPIPFDYLSIERKKGSNIRESCIIDQYSMNANTEPSRNTATNESFTFIALSKTEKEVWTASILKTIQKSKERVPTVIEFLILSIRFVYTNREACLSLPVAIEGSEIAITLKKYAKKVKKEITSPLTCNILFSTIFAYEGEPFLLVACNNWVFLRLKNGRDSKFQKVINYNCVTMVEANYKHWILFILNNHNLLYFSLTSILGTYYDKKLISIK